MGKDSHIEWTDHTFNPWEGCTKVSPGCAHCYAEARNKRFGGGQSPNWGKGAPRRRTSVQNWNQVRKWNREAGELLAAYNREVQGSFGHLDEMMDEPHRPRVFCASLADWLDNEVPIEWLVDLLELIRTTPNLDWLLLTKRPQNFPARVGAFADLVVNPSMDLQGWVYDWFHGKPPENVWIGTSVEDQTRADERIPLLRSIPAQVRFLSMEPLLGDVNLYAALKVCASWSHGGKSWRDGPYSEVKWAPQALMPYGWKNAVDWVIVGGESGPDARPIHPNWARSLRDQCQAAGVAFLFKQWGEWIPVCEKLAGSTIGPSDTFVDAKSTVIQLNGEQRFAFPAGAMTCLKIGKKVAGRLLDGREWNEFPHD